MSKQGRLHYGAGRRRPFGWGSVILSALRENSRVSAAAIARQLGIAPSTVKRRIEAPCAEHVQCLRRSP
ncbi:AsnC family transcriptional regulator [Microbacterium sp. NPDC076895]|uniref:AsnC family transcriptional regulator n=1 Tax=Microbacterium sp. NPDC076895 TaxID=3154957 RepID=UPI0034335C7D